jgi:hypothetical protein
MAIPEYLQSARDRMESAQKAMMDFIDKGSGDMDTRHALLQEVHDGIAAFEEAIARLNSEYSN